MAPGGHQSRVGRAVGGGGSAALDAAAARELGLATACSWLCHSPLDGKLYLSGETLMRRARVRCCVALRVWWLAGGFAASLLAFGSGFACWLLRWRLVLVRRHKRSRVGRRYSVRHNLIGFDVSFSHNIEHTVTARRGPSALGTGERAGAAAGADATAGRAEGAAPVHHHPNARHWLPTASHSGTSARACRT